MSAGTQWWLVEEHAAEPDGTITDIPFRAIVEARDYHEAFLHAAWLAKMNDGKIFHLNSGDLNEIVSDYLWGAGGPGCVYEVRKLSTIRADSERAT